MRNTSKITTLENKFPLWAVEHGCIISKDADITVAFEVELPELYTVTSAEYETIHGCWCKAVRYCRTSPSCTSRTGSSARPTNPSCKRRA